MPGYLQKVRAVLIATAIALANAGPAEAYIKTLRVDDAAQWLTPQRFDKDARMEVAVTIRGQMVDADYQYGRTVGWHHRGVTVEAVGKKHRIWFRVVNWRSRDAAVRLRYRAI